NQLFVPKVLSGEGGSHYNQVELPDGSVRPLSKEERSRPELLPDGAYVFQTTSLFSAGWTENGSKPFEFEAEKFYCGPHQHWSTSHNGLQCLAHNGRIRKTGKNIRYKRYF